MERERLVSYPLDRHPRPGTARRRAFLGSLPLLVLDGAIASDEQQLRAEADTLPLLHHVRRRRRSIITGRRPAVAVAVAAGEGHASERDDTAGRRRRSPIGRVSRSAKVMTWIVVRNMCLHM